MLLIKNMYKNWKRNRALPVSISVSVIILVAVSTAQLSSMITSDDNIAAVPVYAKRHSTNFEQAASLVNNCSGDGASGTICVNNNPQTEGKNNDVNTPINSQISNTVEAAPPGPNQILQARQVSSDSVIVAPGTTENALANCDADEVVTGGGELVRNAATGNELNPDHSGVRVGNGWLVTYTNPGPENIEIIAFAECAQLVDVP
jgi:hypothetical protein